MSTQWCRHCKLPFVDSEIRDGNCPICLRNFTGESATESAQSAADAPSLPEDSLRRWRVLAASQTLVILLLGGAVVWLSGARPSGTIAELPGHLNDADGNELKTTREQLKAAQASLKTAQEQFEAKCDIIHGQLQELQATHQNTQEKLARAEAELQAAEQRALEAKAKSVELAEKTSVEELRKAGDVRGLVAKLGDPRGKVRSQAAFALSQLANKLEDPGAEIPAIGPLIDACMRDPWKGTREQAGHALMHVLSKSKDQKLLSAALQPLLDALNHQQVELDRRRRAAVGLSAVVMRLERVDLLHDRVPDLLTATFQDPDDGVREYAGRALQHTLQKLDHEPTLTIAAQALAAQLTSETPRARSYSAVMLSGVVRKITDRDTLKSLLGRITPAATNDADQGVREYAGRAMHHIQNVMKQDNRK